MKKVLNLSFAFLFVLGFVSCTDDDNDTLTGSNTTGGLLNVETNAIAYIQGAPASDVYTADLSVFQGRDMVESVDVYKKFYHTDAATGVVSSSESAVLTSFSFPVVDQHESYQVGFTYADLIAGLSLNGTALSSDDSTLTIGDYWILTYVANLTDGTTAHTNAKTTKVTVSCGSFLAGNYVINYTTGPQPIVVSALGGGLYYVDYFPTFSTAYWWEFSDVCGDLTITDWQYQSGNAISGTSSPMPHGVVNTDGSITFTGVNVAGVSWYVDRSWTIYPN